MKKVALILLSLTAMILTACGGSKEVTITIPTNLSFVLDELTAEGKAELEEYLESYGAKNITYEDDQYAFTMTKADHKDFIKDVEHSIEETFAYYQEREHGHFLEMEVKDNYEHIYVRTESDALEEHITWTLPITTLGVNVLMYQLYSGVAADDLHVTVHIINEETEEEFESVEFPAFFNGEIK